MSLLDLFRHPHIHISIAIHRVNGTAKTLIVNEPDPK